MHCSVVASNVAVNFTRMWHGVGWMEEKESKKEKILSGKSVWA